MTDSYTAAQDEIEKLRNILVELYCTLLIEQKEHFTNPSYCTGLQMMWSIVPKEERDFIQEIVQDELPIYIKKYKEKYNL